MPSNQTPTPTACPRCGYVEASTVCHICKADKTKPFEYHDEGEYKRDQWKPHHDLDPWGRPLKEGT